MIIQIRGTSGSGKSTVVREVMSKLGGWEPQYVDGRRKPLYYFRESNGKRGIVLGHYDTACGGCDTIGAAPRVFSLTQELEYDYLISEGLLLGEDSKWSLQMDNLRVVFLTTPLEECLSRIVNRRKEKGNEKPLNPHNTTRRVFPINRAREKLSEAGVLCRRASSTQASDIIVRWINAID